MDIPLFHPVPLNSCTIVWYKDWNIVPCSVSVLSEVIKGRAVLVTEYCMEAKTWFAASVLSAFAVHARIKLALLYFPSVIGKPFPWVD